MKQLPVPFIGQGHSLPTGCESVSAAMALQYLGFSVTAEDFARVLMASVADRQKLAEVGVGASREVYVSWEDAIDRAYRRYVEVVEAWPYPLPYRKRLD